MSRRAIASCTPIVSLCIAAGAAFAQGVPHSPGDVSAPRAFLEQTCIHCHSEEASSAMAVFSGFYLDRLNVDQIEQHPEEWEKVVRKLRTGMMPPASEPRPDPVQEAEFIAYLESGLDRLAARNPNPGRPALHRLNRTEYQNAIRDLLALEVDARALLPIDDASFGFDNIAASLNVSPALVERYANAADRISRLAVGDMTMQPEQSTHYVPNFWMQGEHIEGLPFGTRGGVRVEHFFPLDGEYVITVDLMSAVDGVHIGNGIPGEQLEVSIDGQRIGLFDLSPPRAAEEAEGEAEPVAEDGEAPPESPPRDRTPTTTKWPVRVSVTAGPHTLTTAFIKKNHAPIEDIVAQPSNTLLDPLSNGTPEVTMIAHVGSVVVDGPYEASGRGTTPSRERIFTCRPQQPSEEAACAREILSTLATRAYRRPVATEHVSVLIDFFEQGKARGGFDEGIRIGVQRILSSPQFLFRFERDAADAPADRARPIGDLELASRLSFFLWSSVPDDELLDLAARGRLSRSGVLAAQVERMLADPKAAALTKNFAGQWLYLRNLEIKDASTYEFPDFDDNLRHAFRTETEMLFEHVVREDKSVLELFTADYTFVNERLAKHYGIPGIYGSHFRRVPVTDEYRKGLLGHGSVLLVTSQPNRTSPINRGVWILENVLGAHVPLPPPVAIPALEEAAGEGVNFDELSVRELMELHRSKPFCEGCHKIMDPVGLAMENFDVVGRWRTHEGATPIDASGTLVDGTVVNGPVELRQALLKYEEQIVRNVTEKLLTYALGRGLEYHDMPVVRSIVRDAAAEDYRFSALVMGVVMSDPFRMRAPEGLASTVVASERR